MGYPIVMARLLVRSGGRGWQSVTVFGVAMLLRVVASGRSMRRTRSWCVRDRASRAGLDVRENMGVPWIIRDGICECIPPIYAEYVGRQLIAML